MCLKIRKDLVMCYDNKNARLNAWMKGFAFRLMESDLDYSITPVVLAV